MGKIQNRGCLGVVAGCRDLLGRGRREVLGVMATVCILTGLGFYALVKTRGIYG